MSTPHSDVLDRSGVVLVSLILLLGRTAMGSLVAYWPFDGDCVDKVGNRVARLHGGTGYELGYLGEAVQLHGCPDGVELPIGELLSTLSNCTFSLWVNPSDADAAWRRIFSFGRDPTVDMYLTGDAVPPDALQLYIGNGEPHRWMPAPRALSRGWHQIAVVVDAGEQRCTIYVDGGAVVLEPKLPPELVPSRLGRTTENWLGCSPYAHESHFQGAIDEMAIFDHALTESEIKLLHECSAALFLQEDADSFTRGFEQATWSLTAGQSKRAEMMLREMLVQYATDARTFPKMSRSTVEAPLGPVYALLAEADQGRGAAIQDVVKLLAQSMQFAGKNESYAGIILSLFDLVPRKEFETLVSRSLGANLLTPSHLHRIAQAFQTRRRWDVFEAFLRILLESSFEPDAFAAEATAALEETPWSARLRACLAKMSQLSRFNGLQSARRARDLIQDQWYAEAADAYRDLVEASTVPTERRHYELESIRCTFLQGRYAETSRLAEAFVRRNPTMEVSQLKRTLLLKASALLGDRDVDGAIRACLEALTAGPATDEDREVEYLIGYCQMLQGRPGRARQTLDSLVAAYPRSREAARARLLLGRIGGTSPQPDEARQMAAGVGASMRVNIPEPNEVNAK